MIAILTRHNAVEPNSNGITVKTEVQSGRNLGVKVSYCQNNPIARDWRLLTKNS